MTTKGNNICTLALGAGADEQIAIFEAGRSVTFEALRERVAKGAAVLEDLGVTRGDRVGIFAPDTAETVVLLLSVLHLGAVAVPISELERPTEVKQQLDVCQAKVLFVGGRDYERLLYLLEEVTSVEKLLPVSGGPPETKAWASLCRLQTRVCKAADVTTDDLALVFVRPDFGLVGHSHRTVRMAGEAQFIGDLALTASDRVLCLMRLHSWLGVGLGLLFPLSVGASVVLAPMQPTTPTVVSALEKNSPTLLLASPSVYAQLSRDLSSDRIMHKLRMCVSGAEGLPARLVPRIHELLSVPVVVGYGLTETFAFVLHGQIGQVTAGSCGRPAADVNIRLVTDDGVAADNEIGTLEIQCNCIAPVVTTADGEEPVGAEGWFRTRDRFMRLESGDYLHCGRKDELFKVSGKWVAPSEVEQSLLAHEAVWECAVIGMEDADGLTKPLAKVVANVGYDANADLAAELKAFVKETLAPYKYPRRIEFVDSLPKGPNGKILRYKLKDRK